MNYELAKNLKDSGFPQTWREGMDFYWTEDRRLEMQSCSDIGREADARGFGIKVPSLPELIEACGESFSKLQYYEEEEKPWRASGWIDDALRTTISLTHEEAVARLWLLINKPIDSPVDK